MLKQLLVNGIGPENTYSVEFSNRLNIFTGDNGLGKSLLLDLVWWSITGDWFKKPPYPNLEKTPTPTITAVIEKDETVIQVQTNYLARRQKWISNRSESLPLALAIYVGMDGDFAVWDSLRNLVPKPKDSSGTYISGRMLEADAYVFNAHELWYGKRDETKDTVMCKGLIQDFVEWQTSRVNTKQLGFDFLGSILREISAPDERIEIAEPKKLFLDDSREYPVLRFSYGETPAIFSSAAIKRILGLSYLLVWTWIEHIQSAKLAGTEPTTELILIFDEVESHLHPRWQLSIMDALLQKLGPIFSKDLKTQFFVTTHSPLILSSVESLFSEDLDRLFLFDEKNGVVNLEEQPWIKRGDALGWFASAIFELSSTRSKLAQSTLLKASEYMNSGNITLEEALAIEDELTTILPDNDPFWLQWRFFRESKLRKKIALVGGVFSERNCLVEKDFPAKFALLLPEANMGWDVYDFSNVKNSVYYYEHSGRTSQPPKEAVKMEALIKGVQLLSIEPLSQIS